MALSLPLVIRPPTPVEPSQAVVERLRGLPLHTLDDVRAHFAGIPIELAERSPHFGSLRLLTTSTCRMRCQYPDEQGLLWCHNEGIERNGLPAADLDETLRVVTYFRERHGISEVVLAGLQPLLNDELLAFMRALRERAGITKISMTSHGLRLLEWLPRLREAGLDALVLSMQGFDKATYQQVMGLNAFDNARAVVALAQRLGMIVAVNRVVLRGAHHDIPAFLDWVRANDVWIRFYDLVWNPGHDREFLRYHISWQELLPMWTPLIERITVWDWARPGRVNLLFQLRGGGQIETNMSTPVDQHDAAVCQTCVFRHGCTEGWLGCGLRITPDLKLQPCLWRSDLRYDLAAVVTAGPNDHAAAELDNHLRGTLGGA